jgi:signal transduction histidine kinase
MKLSDFIRQQAGSILADWEHRADLAGTARNGHGCSQHPAHLKQILLAASDQMDVARVGEDAPRANGHTADPASALKELARQHAAVRLAQDCALDEVVAELQALRGRVIREWSDHHQAAGPGALDQIMDFSEAVDQAVTTAVACYEQRLRKAAQEQTELIGKLEQSEQRLRALVNASSNVVYRLSPDGSEMRELDGRGVVLDTKHPDRFWQGAYILPDDQPMVIQAFREAFRNKCLYEVEHRYRRVNGKVGWTLSRAVPLFDESGRITEWFGAATDVTARRQAEETLREADRRKEEFLVILGHELRNPLAPLRACVDLLEEARHKPELLRTVYPIMDRQLSHLVRLVDDLLDISRITRGEIQLQRAPLDLNTPVEAAMEQAKAAIAERRHELHVQLSPAPLLIQGDGVRLTQVVANLLNNAAKYMGPGGSIHVSTATENGRAVVRVRDTGYGILPEHFDRLFNLFTQIDEHRAQSGGSGLGIGLALSRQLVTLHGGVIEARSEGPGRGSEFIVRLDLSAAGPAADGPPLPPVRVQRDR